MIHTQDKKDEISHDKSYIYLFFFLVDTDVFECIQGGEAVLWKLILDLTMEKAGWRDRR